MMLLSAVVFSGLSWLRAMAAGTMLVDGHAIGGPLLWLTFGGFLTAVGVYCFSLFRLWQMDAVSIKEIRITAYTLIAIFSLMLPMLSNDLFSLLAYGDAANRGVDVYTDVASLGLSPFFQNVGPLWHHAPCVYGPVCLTTSRMAALLANGNLALAVSAYKVLAVLWAIVFVEFTIRIGSITGIGRSALILILLNPLLMIQGIGQLHCDAIAVALTAGMIYFALSERWYLAYVFAGLAIAAKVSYVLMLPFMFVLLLVRRVNWIQFLTRQAAGVAVTAVVLGLLYFPYFTSVKTITTPFQFLTAQNPAKSIAEIVGDIVYFAPGVIGSNNSEMHSNMLTPSGISQSQLDAWLLVKKVCQVFALVMMILVFARFWIHERTQESWFRTFLRLLLLFLLFYSHVFYPWYLLFILPLLWYESDVKFIQWLLVMSCLAIIQDTISFTRHETVPYYIILILTFTSTMSFFWRFRTVYFRSVSRQ